MRQILHRPRVTLDVPAGRLSDAEALIDEFVAPYKWRYLNAMFVPHHNGGYGGTVTVMVINSLPPPGYHQWVESDLWHPASTLTLHTVTTTADTNVVAEFIGNSCDYSVYESTLERTDSNPPRFRGTVKMYLAAKHGKELPRCVA